MSSTTTPPRDLAHAFARVNAAALRSLLGTATDRGIQLVSSRSAIAIVTAAQAAEFNRVIHLGVFEPATERQLDELLAPYGPAQVPFMVHLLPVARPPELAQWLSKRGLYPDSEWSVLARDLTGPIEDVQGPEVVRIGPELAAAYARVYESAFGLGFGGGGLAASAIGRPGWSHYLARDGDRALAVAAMFVKDRAALFAGSGTGRIERRRGAQRALVARRLSDAAQAGCSVALVETDHELQGDAPEPLRNILRAGFVRVFGEASFVSEHRSHQRLDLGSGRWT